MKVTFNAGFLLSRAAPFRKIMNSKIPAATRMVMKFDSDKGVIECSASNGTIYYSVSVPARYEKSSDKGVEILVDSSRMLAFLGNMAKNQEVSLNLGKKLILSSGNARTSMVWADMREFPYNISLDDDAEEFEIEGGFLADTLSKVTFAASKDDSDSSSLAYVVLDFATGKAIATNKIILASAPLQILKGIRKPVVVGVEALNVLAPIIKSQPKSKLFIDSGMIMVSNSGGFVALRLRGDQPPTALWDMIDKKTDEFEIITRIDRAEFLTFLALGDQFSSRMNIMTLTVQENGSILGRVGTDQNEATFNFGHSSNMNVKTNKTEVGYKLSFDSQTMKGLVGKMDNSLIEMYTNKDRSPIYLFTKGGQISLHAQTILDT